MKIPGLAALAGDVIAACRILEGKRLIEAYGHVSVRIPGRDLVLITPRGAIGLIAARDLLVVDLTGRLVSGRGTLPLELSMHTAVYRRRPEVGALCRTHSPSAVAWSVLGRSLRPVHGFGSFLGAEVPVFPKPDLIATGALGEEMADVLGGAEAVLLRGNGTLVTGATLREACVKAIFLEESAWIQTQAAAAGQPVMMSADELRRRTDMHYDHYGRAWDFYRARYAGGKPSARNRR
ncbi:MAG: class II aldolase/adducin family protein [bacterium]